MCVYIYIYTYVCVCVHMYMYIHLYMQVVDMQFRLPGTAEPMNACPTGTRACSTGPSE